MSTPSDQMPPSPTPPTETADERNVAMLTHLSGLLFFIVVPLVLWLVYKDQPTKRYLVDQAKEALNFQITVLIGFVICAILTFVVIGSILAWILWVVNLGFCIWAAVSISRNGTFRYPICLRLIN